MQTDEAIWTLEGAPMDGAERSTIPHAGELGWHAGGNSYTDSNIHIDEFKNQSLAS